MWFRALVIGFIAYVLFKVITRLVLPFRKMKKDFEEQIKNAKNQSAQQNDPRSEGEVRVERVKEPETKSSKKADEDYVEYEEVD